METSRLGRPIPSPTNRAPTMAERHIRAFPASQPKGDVAPKPTPPRKIDKENSRVAILAAWPNWADRNVSGRIAKDNDVHAFLRSIRSEHPEFFTFRTARSPHETAFFWLLDAGFVAH
jgi:hypothetical protein